MPRLTRILIVAALLAGAAVTAAGQRAGAAKVQDAIDVFKALMAVPEREVPDALMRGTIAVAIVPNVRRVGFIIGGQRGEGVLVVRGEQGGWSRPLFLTLTGASIGWQAGIQSADIVLFFRTRESVERVLRGGYTLGVDASIAAGSLGRSVAAATDSDLTAEIYSYARARGAFAGIALQGTTLAIDDDTAENYYGKTPLSARAVLAGSGLPTPPTAEQLRKVLQGYERSLR